MSYPYFFVKPKNIKKNKIIINGEDLNHLKNVLRIKEKDLVEVSDNNRYRYKAMVSDIKSSEAVLEIKEKKVILKREPKLTLFQCILKKNAMEFAVQKATEIGIDKIKPVFSSRVILDRDKVKNKVYRWQKIAEQASKQSKRDFISEVYKPVDISDIELSEYDIFYLPTEIYVEGEAKEENFLSKIFNILGKNKNIKNIGYIVGPEGGFESEEVQHLKNRGAILINLGENILRAETASIYILSILDYLIKIFRG